jgi:hypothetical protein
MILHHNGHLDDVLCVPSLSWNLISMYQITHLDVGKIVEFSPHQVVIKDLKNPKHVLATKILMMLPRYTSLKILGHHIFH